jgi:hypothetical protein
VWRVHQVTSATIATEMEELLCIVRLESDANNTSQFRITVACNNQIACASLKNIIVHHLVET